jgi:predicted nucleic acid-binding protein
VISTSEDIFDQGLSLYKERQDKGWGLTDCISFVVMRERAITEALAADRHFEQAGFKALLRTS